jgi:hypothetical protein
VGDARLAQLLSLVVQLADEPHDQEPRDDRDHRGRDRVTRVLGAEAERDALREQHDAADDQRRAHLERDRRDDHHVVDGAHHRAARLHGRQQHRRGAHDQQTDDPPPRREVADRDAHREAREVEDEPEDHPRAVAVQARLGLRGERDDEHHGHRQQAERPERCRWLLEEALSHT